MKLFFPYILLEKYINILALDMASPEIWNCANYIGTLLFPMAIDLHPGMVNC